MSTLAKLNMWSEKECGIILFYDDVINLESPWTYLPPKYDKNETQIHWTLEDPHCMQVFREKFKMRTYYDINNKDWITDTSRVQATGDTIPEAELACAFAIMNSMEE